MQELNDRLEGPFKAFAKDPAIRKFLSLFDEAGAPLKASVQAALINAFASGANAAPAWQSIETAPKDGQHVLLGVTNDPPGWVTEGYFEPDGDRGWFKSETHWTDATDGSVTPSHWMPLPAAPK